MISCQNCGADNLVGAIFCRACGAKLKIDDIRPQTTDQAKPKTGEHAKHVASRIIIITLLILASSLMIGILVPNARPVIGELSDQEKQSAGSNMRRCLCHHLNHLQFLLIQFKLVRLLMIDWDWTKENPTKCALIWSGIKWKYT